VYYLAAVAGVVTFARNRTRHFVSPG
jgi:hypothetical protein